MTQPAPYAVVLAAGAGSRFGGDKLLAPFQGRPLIAHVAATIADAIIGGVLAGGVAVVPPRAARLVWSLETAGLTIVENPDASSGLASSLRRGLAALATVQPPAGAALIILGDQPLLRMGTITALMEEWRKTGRSVRPRYAMDRERPGHPVLLDRSAWLLADTLRGDTGLGPAFRDRPETVITVDVPGANPDVDTPGDLHSLEDSR
jgi:CTP:molybdopterin cytidylyltransferase MocA